MSRTNGNWREACRELLRQHNQFVKENGKLTMKGRKKNGWSINDTAKALSISLGKASENIRLAKALNRSPELMQFAERQEAIHHLKVKGEW